MINLINIFFEKRRNKATRDQTSDKYQNIRVATCALLLEISYIDGEFSESERKSIIAILKKDYELSEDEAVQLIDASTKELKESVDLWQFTNLINQNYSLEEKKQVIETVWKVAYSDGRFEKHEDYLVHKLASLLRLSHKQLIEAKIRAKKMLNCV